MGGMAAQIPISVDAEANAQALDRVRNDKLREALRSGQMPSREIADAALVFVGGLLLTLPGFVSDVVGLVFVLPFTRPIARIGLEAVVARRLLAAGLPVAPGEARVRRSPRREGRDDGGEVVDERGQLVGKGRGVEREGALVEFGDGDLAVGEGVVKQ